MKTYPKHKYFKKNCIYEPGTGIEIYYSIFCVMGNLLIVACIDIPSYEFMFNSIDINEYNSLIPITEEEWNEAYKKATSTVF